MMSPYREPGRHPDPVASAPDRSLVPALLVAILLAVCLVASRSAQAPRDMHQIISTDGVMLPGE